jgi:hypothetical protein
MGGGKSKFKSKFKFKSTRVAHFELTLELSAKGGSALG